MSYVHPSSHPSSSVRIRIVRVVSSVAYELELPDTMSRVHPVFHVSKLKAYRDGSSAFPDRQQRPSRPAPELLPDTGEEAWEVTRGDR